MLKPVTVFLLVVGQCDLIGYNRQQNNVANHIRVRQENNLKYQFQIAKWVLENNRLNRSERDGMYNTLFQYEKRAKTIGRNNRFSLYKAMGSRITADEVLLIFR